MGFVGSVNANTNGGTSIAVPYTASAVGNYLVVFVSLVANGSVTPTISDGHNTYTLVLNVDTGYGILWYAPITTAGALVITISFSGSTTGVAQVVEYSGVASIGASATSGFKDGVPPVAASASLAIGSDSLVLGFAAISDLSTGSPVTLGSITGTLRATATGVADGSGGWVTAVALDHVGTSPVAIGGSVSSPTGSTLVANEIVVLELVAPALSVAATATPTTGSPPLPVAFTATPSGGNGPFTYAWTFGDGGISSFRDPAHTYASSGTFVARVVVTDANLGTAPDDAPAVTVTTPAPKVQDPGRSVGGRRRARRIRLAGSAGLDSPQVRVRAG